MSVRRNDPRPSTELIPRATVMHKNKQSTEKKRRKIEFIRINYKYWELIINENPGGYRKMLLELVFFTRKRVRIFQTIT